MKKMKIEKKRYKHWTLFGIVTNDISAHQMANKMRNDIYDKYLNLYTGMI